MGDPNPLKFFTDPTPVFSSEYHVKKYKIISLTYLNFFSLVNSIIYFPFRKIVVTNVAF
jgi:hypothetical protein